jgi:septum site-determining protein MinD
MTRFIAIASGKGGVGKTTTAVNLCSALSDKNHDSVIIDANLSTPNVGLHLGIPNHVPTFHDVIEGRKHILDSVFTHASGMKVIPSDLSYDRTSKYKPDMIEDVLLDIVGHTDIVLMDTSAGIGSETENIVRFCDEALIVCNPNLSSVIDARKTIKMCHEHGVKVLGAVVTRYRGDEYDMSKNNIESVLDYPVISIIPEDDSVRISQSMRYPVCKTHPKSFAARSYSILADKVIRRSV